jgi:hypothetical protein
MKSDDQLGHQGDDEANSDAGKVRVLNRKYGMQRIVVTKRW